MSENFAEIAKKMPFSETHPIYTCKLKETIMLNDADALVKIVMPADDELFELTCFYANYADNKLKQEKDSFDVQLRAFVKTIAFQELAEDDFSYTSYTSEDNGSSNLAEVEGTFTGEWNTKTVNGETYHSCDLIFGIDENLEPITLLLCVPEKLLDTTKFSAIAEKQRSVQANAKIWLECRFCS